MWFRRAASAPPRTGHAMRMEQRSESRDMTVAPRTDYFRTNASCVVDFAVLLPSTTCNISGRQFADADGLAEPGHGQVDMGLSSRIAVRDRLRSTVSSVRYVCTQIATLFHRPPQGNHYSSECAINLVDQPCGHLCAI